MRSRVGVLSILLFFLSAQADTWVRHHTYEIAQTRVDLWGPEQLDQPDTLQKIGWNLQEKLEGAVSNALFSTLGLPSRLALMIDPDLQGPAAYVAPELAAPDGTSAILFSPQALLDSKNLTSRLVHELAHLSHYSLNPGEEAWVEEGVAMLSEYAVTRKLNFSFEDGYNSPNSSLTASLAWEGDRVESDELLRRYGHVNLFFYYIYRNCGADALLSELFKGGHGVQGVDAALKRVQAPSSTCASFREAFKEFQLARFAPSFSTETGYVLASGYLKAKIQAAPPAQELEPFSAYAFVLPSNGRCPRKGDIRPSHEALCLRIRYE